MQMMVLLRRRLTVHLCFVCLLVLTLQKRPKPCAPDITGKVQHLMKDRKTDLTLLDSRLYTPTLDDYRKCPRSTMKCFADEIQVLIEEWDTVPFKGFKLNSKLRKLAMLLNQTEECLQCELSEEQRAERFLEHLLKTLEYMNNQYC